MDKLVNEPLALQGGPQAVQESDRPEKLLKWPQVTAEDEAAVLEVLRAGTMSGTDVTKQFEAEFAAWNGTKYALGCCNGTAALLASMWACGVGAGDEIIGPSMTYWASVAPALQLGAAVNFADIEEETLCIDPEDIEHRIGPRTKAIVVVHYTGYPCDMDRILPIAQKHGLKVIEDVSHAQGSLYKGRMTGTFGDIAAMSLMSGKSFPTGEGGILVTDDLELYERCIAYGHYARTGTASNYNPANPPLTTGNLAHYAGLPIGGAKHRMNQLASAMGRSVLRRYPKMIEEIQNGINRFWDLLEGVPGIHAHRPPAGSGSTMGGWYNTRGLYRAEELGGLPIEKFTEAVTAEGCPISPGANFPLHLHPLFQDADIFGTGKPTMISWTDRDVRQDEGSLPVTERIKRFCLSVPYFKHDDPECIEAHAAAYAKVARQADKLL
jgi:dTDP-4-amino-4,6-dideoxygalactose transaminase